MTMTISEALNQAEALSAGLDWILLPQYEVSPEYTSPEVSIDLDNRVIGDLSENVSTEGENNAEYISFIMDRYHDGVDLSDMLIQIQYELEDGSGSINGVVNAYMNDEQIKFGWVIPPAAAQTDAVIKIMVFCTGIIGTKAYTIKTLPIEYTIHSTLEIGGSIPEPDENWYLQFVSSMDEKVRTAQSYKEAAAQSASNASDDLADIEKIQADVNDSKSTIQTLAAQVQSNATKAQASEDAAKVSEENAEEWFNKTKEHSGVSYASKELAGTVAPQDVYVNPENGHMNLITRTTDITLSNSYAGGIKVNKVYGKSEQKQYSGKNLLDCSGLTEQISNGVTFTPVYDDNGNLLYVNANGTATENANFTLTNTYTENSDNQHILSGCPSGGSSSTYYLTYMEWDASWGTVTGVDELGKGVVLSHSENAVYSRVIIVIRNGATVNNLKFYPMVRLSSVTDSTYEPYVGGIPSPNPDYPQDIKSVVNPMIIVSACGKYGNLLTEQQLYFMNENYGIFFTSKYVWAIYNKNIYMLYDYEPEHSRVHYRILNPDGVLSFEAWGKSTYYISMWKGENGIILHADNSFQKVSVIETLGLPNAKQEQQTATLPYTLNAIPVSSGGNVTIDGQQYIADYVDVERGKLVRMVEEGELKNYSFRYSGSYSSFVVDKPSNISSIIYNCYCSHYKNDSYSIDKTISIDTAYVIIKDKSYNNATEFNEYLQNNDIKLIYVLSTPEETDLTDEDLIALHSLKSFNTATYIFTDSEIEPVIDLEYGTSRVGGYVLECYNDKEIMKLEIASMKAAQVTTEEEVTA